MLTLTLNARSPGGGVAGLCFFCSTGVSSEKLVGRKTSLAWFSGKILTVGVFSTLSFTAAEVEDFFGERVAIMVFRSSTE